MNKVDDIARAAQLACCLEVSGYPKPGNVHRLRDFKDTRFEHFLAGSIALGPPVRKAAIRGVKIGVGELNLKEAGVGALIRKAVSEVKKWHRGGNTHLGISLLFIPLAISAGVCIAKYGNFRALREWVSRVVKSTTSIDAVEFYRAIRIVNPGGLGRVEGEKRVDATEDNFEKEILSKGVTLYDLMKESSSWDIVAWEFVNALKSAFEVGYPKFWQIYEETSDVNIATVHTFLELLAFRPDTLIARKIGLKYTEMIDKAVEIGLKEAEKYSRKAREILELGGLKTVEGRHALKELDEELAQRDLNPGSTADILATSIYISILYGFRP